MGRDAGLRTEKPNQVLTSTNPRKAVAGSLAPTPQSATYSELFKTSGYTPSQGSSVNKILQPAYLYNSINKNTAPTINPNTVRAALGNLLNTKTGSVFGNNAPAIPKPTSTTQSAGSGSNGGSSGGGSGLSSQLQSIYQQQLNAQQTAANNLSNQLKAQQEAYQAQLRAMQEAQQQAAQNAYNNNLVALQNAYNSRLSGLDSNFAATKDLLNSSYENSRQNLNSQAEKALQEAYINRMMNERNMTQQLNAQGLNGGAAESTIASMLNNYGNARNNINLSADNSLRELEQSHNSNLANALQKYNDALSDAQNANMAYRMQLENDLNNNVLGSYQNMYNAFSNLDGGYANLMADLIAQQAGANADLQEAMYKQMVKDVGSVNTSANVSGGSGGLQAVANNTRRNYEGGSTPQSLAQQLQNEGYTTEQIVQIFKDAAIPMQ